VAFHRTEKGLITGLSVSVTGLDRSVLGMHASFRGIHHHDRKNDLPQWLKSPWLMGALAGKKYL